MKILLKRSIPWIITSLRLAILPLLAYAFSHGYTIVTYGLFLFAISTDLTDGYIARKINAQSTYGVWFDAIVDYVFISGMFLVFIEGGLYPAWILAVISFVFVQFLLTSVLLKQLYDPIGKYYGSVLYGAIGLTLLFSGRSFQEAITIGIVIVTIASVMSRIVYITYRYNRFAQNSKMGMPSNFNKIKTAITSCANSFSYFQFCQIAIKISKSILPCFCLLDILAQVTV